MDIYKDIYKSVCACVHTHVHVRVFFLICQVREPTPPVRFILNLDVVSSTVPFSNKRNWGFLEKWMVPELREEVEKIAQDTCGDSNIEHSPTNKQNITPWRKPWWQVWTGLGVIEKTALPPLGINITSCLSGLFLFAHPLPEPHIKPRRRVDCNKEHLAAVFWRAAALTRSLSSKCTHDLGPFLTQQLRFHSDVNNHLVSGVWNCLLLMKGRGEVSLFPTLHTSLLSRNRIMSC